MKERRIKIIIGLMTVALLGLIGFQYYLIKSLVKVEQERFDRLVSEALNSVVTKIDRKEALSAVQNKMAQQIDTIHHAGGLTIKKVTNDSLVDIEQIITNQNGFKFVTKSGDQTSTNSVVILEEKVSGLTGEEIFINENQDTVLISKYNLVTEVVTDLLTKKIDLETRLSSLPLDSLLNQELVNRGIELSHEYGVVNKESKFIFVSEVSDSNKVVNSEYSVTLFPMDLTGNRNQLKVYFADTSTYILGNITWMLLLSGLFILTIGIIFFITIQMLLRQKKITEIKNDLINNITHEFKTPLSTISIATETLIDPDFRNDSSQLKKYTSLISTENKRLTAMVESLLSAAAFESNNYKLKLEKVSIHSIIEKVFEDNATFFKMHSAEVNLFLNAANNFSIVDKFHLANVFKNILENAVKYNEATPKLEISTVNKNSSILISFKDNGIGISKEHQAKIFDTFYRVPTGNIHNVKGNGIGLSYVKKMVTAHNGKIELISKLNFGSTFTITLPVVENE